VEVDEEATAMSTTSTRSDGTVQPLSTAASFGGVLVLLLTLFVAVMPGLFVYGVITEYGPGDMTVVWDVSTVLTYAAYVGVAGLLGAASWWFLRRMSERPPTLTWVAGIVVALVAGLLPVVLAPIAAAQWRADQDTIAGACQPDEVRAVESLRPYGFEGPDAQGQTDGTCSGWVMITGDDRDAVMSTLWQRMERDGWTTTDDDAYARTWTRDGMTVRVWHIQSSDGSTGVGVAAA
jgi:hypothetical protein